MSRPCALPGCAVRTFGRHIFCWHHTTLIPQLVAEALADRAPPDGPQVRAFELHDVVRTAIRDIQDYELRKREPNG